VEGLWDDGYVLEEASIFALVALPEVTRGDDNERGMRVGGHGLDHFETGHARHFVVRDDDIEMLAVHELAGGTTIGRGGDIVAEGGESDPQDVPYLGAILDVQDSFHGERGLRVSVVRLGLGTGRTRRTRVHRRARAG
jgi:hypothetical protein